jgi:membrane-bound lytic murein transglycosylase D
MIIFGIWILFSCAPANLAPVNVKIPENKQPPVIEPPVQAVSSNPIPATAPSPAENIPLQIAPPPLPPSEESESAVEFIEEEDTPVDVLDLKNTSPAKKRSPAAAFEEALDFCQAAQDFWQKGELDNALEALDQAYSLILEADAGDDPKLLQQKEDIRFTISKRILEIYTSRHIVVNGKQKEIPLTLNSDVQEEINSFSIGKERDFFLESYARSGRYRPLILKALAQAGLPPELSWMPLIESGFKVNALSVARALGLWQFIPSTGYKYGLKRTMHIDERLDPIKSTEAAIAYLKELHQMFGDWATVLAAYNCGEHRVLRVIREQNVNYLDNFWDLYARLPRETARYVPRFLATLHMVNHPEKYGLDSVSLEPPLSFETVTISKQIHLYDIAKKINVSDITMKQLNPELRHQIVPGDQYALRVPVGMREPLTAVLDEIPISGPPRLEYVYHRVRKGDTLSSISKQYHASVTTILNLNQIRGQRGLSVGKIIKIPQQVTSEYSKPVGQVTSLNNIISHVVKAGDSLFNIAKRYSTTTETLKQLNGLAGSELNIGQVLKVPTLIQKEPIPEPAAGKLRAHIVRKGDTPRSIALQYGMSIERLLKLNGLKTNSKIYPKQKILVE